MSSELDPNKLADVSVAFEQPPAPAAVRISSVSKCYQIYDQPQDRLKQAIMPRLHRLIRANGRPYFREFWALRDVSFSVSKGETIGIIGRNGSGKSTLLQTLCGTLSPTSGEVEINGRVGALLELGSGFNPEFSGRENVYLSGAVLGLSKEQVDERFDRIVEFSEIGDFLDQPVKQYSSGMYVRLAFSVIAHADADILVIDEALSVGDVFFAQKCMRFLRDFMQRGTVIFVSHDTSAVLNLCDRAIWLNRGQVVADGPAKQVVSRYLEDLYYETPSAVESDPVVEAVPSERAAADERDVRQDVINASQLRNEIEVFDFSALSRSFGTGKAQVIGASFFNAEGESITWLVGGEPVRLSIKCMALEDIDQPIVGFEVYDRLGQIIFADNTFLTTLGNLNVVRAGQKIEANFEFSMPIMREGDYTISLAIASGTQDNHVQHQWLHEALAFHVHTRTICLGLVAVPMRSIELKVNA